jgi:putative thiamine transport system permease protein
MLRLAPHLTVALFLVPILAGLAGTLLPAFDVLPALGRTEPSLRPWRELAAYPGFATALTLTLTVGFGATILSLALAAGFCAALFDTRAYRVGQRWLGPLLATPHVAIAAGLAFLVAPSGWLVRLVSPELTGWTRPPMLVTVRDPYGLSLMAGLLLKEVPYLVLMIVGATAQTRAGPMMQAARSMGYGRAGSYAKVVLPQVYRQIRLPVYAVLAFSLSVVDVALVLGPGNPPTLAVLATRWFTDYDLSLYPAAAAAATLQLLLVVAGVALWRAGEVAAGAAGRAWIGRGARRGPVEPLAAVGAGLGILAGLAGLLSILGMGVWSLSAAWRFPDALPARWSLEGWTRADGVWPTALVTLGLGLAASLIAAALALACLENEARRGRRPGGSALWLLYLPLLVPQIAFLFGAQVALVRLGLDGSWIAVAWAHLLFTLPYVFLSLADPYRALDARYPRIAAALGASPARTFLQVKLPMLLRPLLIATAVGLRGERGAVPADALRRGGARGDAHHRGRDPVGGRGPADHRGLRRAPGRHAARPLRPGAGAARPPLPEPEGAAMSEGLALHDVRIGLGGRPLFAPVTLAVGPGEAATVMGPSGSGKSTLLAYASGFLDRAFTGSGRVAIGGEDVTGLPPSGGGRGSCSRTTSCFRTSPSAATSPSG